MTVLAPAVAFAALAALLVWLRPPAPSSNADAALLTTLRAGEPLGGVAPLWWLVGRGLLALTGSAFAPWHLAVVGAWVALLWAVWRLAGWAGSGQAGTLAALVAVAVWPPLLWRAGTVGAELSGTALAAVAAYLLLCARRPGGPLWPGALAVVGACGVWAQSVWLVVPLAAWVGTAAWRDGRSREVAATLGSAMAAVGATWGGWWLVGGLVPASWQGGDASWVEVVVGSPWLGLFALLLAGVGGAAAWRNGKREVVVLASAGAALAAVAALLTTSSSLLLAVPAVALLWSGLGASGSRCRWAALVGVAVWALAAVGWAWRALQARRGPAPAWAALGWAREHLVADEQAVIYDPELAPMVRLVLGPAGFDLRAGNAKTAREAIDAGQGPVRIGLRAEPGAKVLKAWRWPSGRVQRLVRTEDAACVVSKLGRTDPVRVSRGWRKVSDGFELVTQGTVALETDTPAQTLTLRVASGRARVRMAGCRGFELGKESSLVSLVLVPGPAGAVVFAPLGGPVRFSDVELRPHEGGGYPAVIVPQVAAVPGIGGSYWQTDLVLANPYPVAATAEVLFLPSERANPTARSVRFEVPARGSRLVENVLAVRELRQGPRGGALLVRTTGCTPPACGLEVLSRTYNAQSESCDPVGEGLPGLPPERGLGAGGTAVFEGVINDGAHRGYVGFASWSSSPVRVRAVLQEGDGQVVGQLDERLEAWSHRHLRLPASCRQATLTVTVEGGPEALVFPYLSTVSSVHNCSTHRYAERVQGTPTVKPRPVDPELEGDSRGDG